VTGPSAALASLHPKIGGAATPKRLMEGSEAIVEAAIAAGCRFFAGYPMTPFTEVLERFAARLPEVGGVCVNAESELEAVGMAWGALATGARAATGSTGQGLSLMQESFSEITLAELPLVAFNMARGQGDYYQATRGGGHGDYRHIVLAPIDLGEAVELTQLAFHLADTWRNPVLVYGDYLLAHTSQAVSVEAVKFGPVPEKEWAVDGSLAGTGRSRIVTPLNLAKHGQGPREGIEPHLRRMTEKYAEIARTEMRVETAYTDDAETVIVAFGSPAKFVRYAIDELRADGERIGFVRPITLWPFPSEAVAAAAAGARAVATFELCAGQMVDDVRLAVLGAAPVTTIGGISTDHSGFGVGRLYDTDVVRERVLAIHRGTDLPPLP
jgi:2-oxoglutarate/2-oxoacid ferredoxin oxidoreductase subunit alpha